MMIKIVLGDGRKAIALRSTLPILIETCALWTHIIEELQTLVVFSLPPLTGSKCIDACAIYEEFVKGCRGSRGVTPALGEPTICATNYSGL